MWGPRAHDADSREATPRKVAGLAHGEGHGGSPLFGWYGPKLDPRRRQKRGGAHHGWRRGRCGAAGGALGDPSETFGRHFGNLAAPHTPWLLRAYSTYRVDNPHRLARWHACR